MENFMEIMGGGKKITQETRKLLKYLVGKKMYTFKILKYIFLTTKRCKNMLFFLAAENL